MLAAACPNCGAEVRFRSNALPVRVCDFCRSTIVRSGEDLTALGKVASVPDDVSPLQLGTRGVHDETPFELVGRIRWRWSDGAWNEWAMLFEDGRQGWLGDAMGRYMLLFEYANTSKQTKVVQQIAKNEPVRIGQEMQIQGDKFTVTDSKTVECVGSEGELPFSTPVGLKMNSVDLGRGDGQCACVQKDRDQIAIYRGSYVSLASLRPTDLRRFEGWAMPDFAR